MNGNWQPYSPGVNGNTASDFVNAWRHFHDLTAQAGARTSPGSGAQRRPGNNYTPYAQVYPGDSYVDWTCLDGYNKSSPHRVAQLRHHLHLLLQQPAPAGADQADHDRRDIVGGERRLEGKLDQRALATQLPLNFPKIKALVWFNWRWYQQSLNYWWPFEIESSSSAQSAFHNGIASSYYAAGGSFGNLQLRSKIAPPS